MGPMVPICTVEKRDLIRMLKIIDPEYEPPNHKYSIEIALSHLYNKTWQKIVAQLQKAF